MRARDLAKIGFFDGGGSSGGKLYHHEVKLKCLDDYSGEYNHFTSLNYYSSSAEPVTKYEDIPKSVVYNMTSFKGYVYYPNDGECLLSATALQTAFNYYKQYNTYYWCLFAFENNEEIDVAISPNQLLIEDIVTEV